MQADTFLILNSKILNSIHTIYFDLDNTLLDHTGAEEKALEMLFIENREIFGDNLPEILTQYKIINDRLWKSLAHGNLTPDQVKTQRFSELVRQFSKVNEQTADELGEKFGEDYLLFYEQHWQLISGAEELLELAKKNFKIGLLTNGFAHIAHKKIKRFSWENTFDAVVISGEVGVWKPHKEIFDHAKKMTQTPESAGILYVGDNFESDILGASSAGWKTVWFNPNGEIRQENVADCVVRNLEELIEILERNLQF